MLRSRLVWLSAFLFLGTANPLFAELFKVVRLTDLRGNSKYQVCSVEDTRKITSELGEEGKCFQKVVEKVKDDWNRTNSQAVFPSSRISPRTMKVINSAIDREEAVKLLEQAKGNEERALIKEEREDSGLLKARAGQGRANRAVVNERKSQVREDRVKDEVADRAEVVVRQKLSAASGHDVPFYGIPPEEPKKARRNKK